VATKDSVAPDCRDVLLMLPMSRGWLSESAAMRCCGVKMGKEGCGQAVAGVDIQSVGGMGRLWGRSNFGGLKTRRGRIGSGGEGGGV
jgi:hypothetical protein